MHTAATDAPAGVGDRVTLVKMANDPCPIPEGSQGTVTRVSHWTDGSWNLGVQWDNGRTLGLIHPVDKFDIARLPKPGYTPPQAA